ncbi:MAG: aminoacetone oxidase family FAD-binding enzyme [Bacteroidaceae bacterium]|nr:aminoacetone oxidase family FAD-binding enzyme [Bacteroidaceae bacterium]
MKHLNEQNRDPFPTSSVEGEEHHSARSPYTNTPHNLPSPSTGEGARKKVGIVGGGAAGFFLAINVKELVPELDVTIFERQRKVLAKVEISGGGRCNCTNTFADVTDLKQVYPRGANLLKRLFKQFSPADAFQWFETHGVPLTIQEDQCVFPEAQDSHAIIDCFLREARRHNIHIQLGTKIEEPTTLLQDFDFVAVTTGGMPTNGTHPTGLPSPSTGEGSGENVWERVCPSLFTFTIPDPTLTALQGLVVNDAIVHIPATSFRSQGPLLITHWGMSGPAILKLSSYAARHLAEQHYQSPLLVNWTGNSNMEEVRQHLLYTIKQNAHKLIDNLRLPLTHTPTPRTVPLALHGRGGRGEGLESLLLPSRLWAYLLSKAGLQGKRCSELGKKGINRLTDQLCNDTYTIAGRSPYKDEFVTCGGIPLDSVDKTTLESKTTPHLFYAGEVLDIDGVTGGFNFQAAWTTAYAVARGIAAKLEA